MNRIFLILVATGLILPTVAVSPAVSTTPDVPVNLPETDETNQNQTTLLYQFAGGGVLRTVEYADGSTFVTVAATEGDGSQQFAVAEGDLQETGSFEYERVSVPAGEERTVELTVPKSSVVVTTTTDGFYYQGSVGPPIITGQTTKELLQISGIGGILGSILALLVVAGQLKRRHQNNYKELFSDERKEIDQGAFEGLRDKVLAWIKQRGSSKYSTAAGIGLLVYVVGASLGIVQPPGELWLNLTDTQRLIGAATFVSMVAAVTPMYFIADRLYSPDRAFILDLDSRDVYRAEAGDKTGTVAAYSGPPEQVASMEIDGATTTISTPGGTAHLVRGFDPGQNTAAGNPPELADDREASIEAQKIDHNRKVLTDLATIGRDLIGAMTAFRVTADSAAMKDIDSGLRDTVSAGKDSMEDVLSEAVAGTRYEGTYQPEQSILDNETDADPDVDDTSDEVTNDSATNGSEPA